MITETTESMNVPNLLTVVITSSRKLEKVSSDDFTRIIKKPSGDEVKNPQRSAVEIR